MQKHGSDIDAMKGNLNTLLAADAAKHQHQYEQQQPAATAATAPPGAVAAPFVPYLPTHSAAAPLTLRPPPLTPLPQPIAVGASRSPANAQCGGGEPLNPRASTATQRWLTPAPAGCDLQPERLAESVSVTKPEAEKHLAGMLFLHKKGIVVAALPGATGTPAPATGGSVAQMESGSVRQPAAAVVALPSVTIVVPTCISTWK